jgi:hypothetical protein
MAPPKPGAPTVSRHGWVRGSLPSQRRSAAPGGNLPRHVLAASPLEAFGPKATHPRSAGLPAPQRETAMTIGKAMAGLNA